VPPSRWGQRTYAFACAHEVRASERFAASASDTVFRFSPKKITNSKETRLSGNILGEKDIISASTGRGRGIKMRQGHALLSSYLRDSFAARAVRSSASRTLLEAISGHDNNYTLIRTILAASVIYFHSFVLSKATGYTDHLSAWLYPITSVGGLAVQLFFFLSGLFVTQSLHRDRRVVGFALKRALRIWPGLFVCLAVTAIASCVVSGSAPLWRYFVFDGLYEYILQNSVFHLTWNIDSVFTGHTFASINGSIHTLPMESKMYVVLACLGLLGLVSKPSRIVVGGLVALGLAFCPPFLKALPFNLFDADYSQTAGALFLSGVIAYGAAQWIKPSLWQGIALGLFAFAVSGTPHVILFFVFVMWFTIYVGQQPSIGKIVRPTQDLSYGIYLYGWPCQQIVLSLTNQHLNPYLLTVLALCLATLCAALSWRWVEKPAIDFGKQLVKFKLRRNSSFNRETLALGKRIALPLLFVSLSCIAMRTLSERHDFVSVVNMPLDIVDFGPHRSQVGEPINQQPNGDSAIWIKLNGTPADGTCVVMDGRRLQTQIGHEFATAKIDSAILKSAGDKQFFLEHRSVNRIERSNIATLQLYKQ
jgi:peptidoglycan/LPS O-acetylase OafA/YrhL